jgi:iron complex transport system ATP-binding protein
MFDLVLRDVTVAGRARARLDAVSLSLSSGHVTVLVGPNGSGKSTLLGVLLGAVRPSDGQVTVEGRSVTSLTARERAAYIGWLPQRPRLEEGLTALEVVVAARFRHAEPSRVAQEHGRSALAALGVLGFETATMDTLSGGEAQRVRLASLLAQDASVWLLDEPGAHLDPVVRLDLVDAINQRGVEGHGVVVVTHDLAVVARLCADGARLVGLRDGHVALDRPGDHADLTDELGAVLGLDLREMDVDGRRGWVVAGRR